MVRKRDRIFALVIAAAFLFTTVGVSVAIIWQIVQENKTPEATTTSTSSNTNQNSSSEGKPMDGFTPVAKVDSLQKIDLQAGSGDEVKPGDTVTVDYTGAIASTGKIFQSSLDTGQPITFGLDQVIVGWKEGVPGMKVGGKRRLLIPADKAYGANPPQGIPANADLVFDITLHKIGQ